jgi:hypothetical protein
MTSLLDSNHWSWGAKKLSRLSRCYRSKAETSNWGYNHAVVWLAEKRQELRWLRWLHKPAISFAYRVVCIIITHYINISVLSQHLSACARTHASETGKPWEGWRTQAPEPSGLISFADHYSIASFIGATHYPTILIYIMILSVFDFMDAPIIQIISNQCCLR